MIQAIVPELIHNPQHLPALADACHAAGLGEVSKHEPQRAGMRPKFATEPPQSASNKNCDKTVCTPENSQPALFDNAGVLPWLDTATLLRPEGRSNTDASIQGDLSAVGSGAVPRPTARAALTCFWTA